MLNQVGSQDSENEAVPAVICAVTSSLTEATLSQCLAIGMVDVLNKPLNEKALRNVVQKYYNE